MYCFGSREIITANINIKNVQISNIWWLKSDCFTKKRMNQYLKRRVIMLSGIFKHWEPYQTIPLIQQIYSDKFFQFFFLDDNFRFHFPYHTSWKISILTWFDFSPPNRDFLLRQILISNDHKNVGFYLTIFNWRFNIVLFEIPSINCYFSFL